MRKIFSALVVIVILTQLVMILHMATLFRQKDRIVQDAVRSEMYLRDEVSKADTQLKDTAEFIERQALTKEYRQEISEGRIRAR